MLRSRLGLLFKVLSVEDGGCGKSCYMEAGLKKVVPNQVGWDARSYYVSRIQFISSRVCLYHKNHENKCVLCTQFSLPILAQDGLYGI